MQLLQHYNPFFILAMVCGLLANASQNEIIGLVDRKAINKDIGFLLEQMAVVWSLMLRYEQSAIAILVDATPRGPQGSCHGTMQTMVFDITKGMSHTLPHIRLLLIESSL